MSFVIRRNKGLAKAIEVALQAAYREGWRDATLEMKRKKARKKAHGFKEQDHLALADLRSTLTAREIVTKALEAKPGLQPVEVFEWAQANGVNITFEAVRQAITRLGKKGDVTRSGAGYALTK